MTGRLFSAALIFLALVTQLSVGQAATPTDRNLSYKLGVGDVIKVTVHSEDDLSISTRIDNSGVFSYPFLGEQQAVGLTVAELEQRLIRGLKPDYLKNPQVQVSVVQYRDFYINGEVRKPGGYAYTPGLTVQKAAALAGGFTERASTAKMFVLRENDRSQEKVRVNMETVIHPGDTLIIEEGLF